MTLEEILEALKSNNDLVGKVAAEFGWVPGDRLKTKTTEVRDLKAEVSRLEGELGTAVEAGRGTDGLRAQVEQLTDKLASADNRYQTYTTITAAGFTDPSVIRGIEQEWASMPEEGRGTLPETIEAWKQAPDTVPGLLRPHFTPAAPADPAAVPDPVPEPPNGIETAPTPAPAPAIPPPPNPHIGARPAQPPGAAQYTAEQIAKATPEQYRAMRKNMGFNERK